MFVIMLGYYVVLLSGPLPILLCGRHRKKSSHLDSIGVALNYTPSVHSLPTTIMAQVTHDSVLTTQKPKNGDRIVERPARGYHKFRNGLLNVTPKGGEMEM